MRRLRPTLGALLALAGEVPTAGWLCALVAVLSGVAWSLIVPPFQVVDEPAHVAYAQYFAETGRPPDGLSGPQARSDEQSALMRALRYKQVEFRPENRPLTSARAQRKLEGALEKSHDRESEGGYTRAAGNPPLYYALAAAAYRLTPSSNLLDRLQLMRLLSALLAGITVLLIFLFLRELLPASPWAWTVGALAVALQPVFGNISGAVHSDNLLYLAAAGVFLAFALSFRRGLTGPRGVAIGLFTAIGILAKPTMLGLLPGIALGVLLLVRRADSGNRRSAIGGAAAAALCAALPVIAYVILNSEVWHRGEYFSGSGEKVRADATTPTFSGYLEYLWQFYLPRLPFMDSHFEDYQLAHVWFDGFVGRFGVLEYGFGTAIDVGAIVVYALVILLAAAELVRCKRSLRSRALELATYVALALGLLVAIHKAGYDGRSTAYTGFEQARYLFPLLALYAAIFALAARGAGRRLGPAAGILLVSLAIAHSMLALLLTLTRYYG